MGGFSILDANSSSLKKREEMKKGRGSGCTGIRAATDFGTFDVCKLRHCMQQSEPAQEAMESSAQKKVPSKTAKDIAKRTRKTVKRKIFFKRGI